jgi:hypothetical protein
VFARLDRPSAAAVEAKEGVPLVAGVITKSESFEDECAIEASLGVRGIGLQCRIDGCKRSRKSRGIVISRGRNEMSSCDVVPNVRQRLLFRKCYELFCCAAGATPKQFAERERVPRTQRERQDFGRQGVGDLVPGPDRCR